MPVVRWVLARLLLGVARATLLTWQRKLLVVPLLSLSVPRLGVVPLKRLLVLLLPLLTVQKVVLLLAPNRTLVEFLVRMKVQLLLSQHPV
jgi:hypothetical protein